MKMNSITRKLLALCMTVLMLASMAVPAFASEQEGVQPPEGEGQNTEQQILPASDVPEHTHSHQAAVTTAATCTAEGVMTYTCACGDTYTAAIPMAEHIYGEAVETAATCTTDGSRVYTCTVEGCGNVYTEVIPATGHSYGEPVVTAASCTADGSRVCTCSVCGNVYTEVIPAAHTYGEPVVTPSACTTDGSRVYTCTVEGCGNVYTEVIPAAHTYGEPVVADAACTVEGSRTYTCTVEGCGYVHTELIPATGHSYVDMVCSACGATECSWQPDCLAAEHYAECIKGNVDKATVLFDALLNELALTETISDEVRSSVNNQMYVICELEYNHRYAWSSREEYAVYQTAVWDVITGKINQLVNELPAADTVNAENFDAVKAKMDKIKLIEEAYRQVWYMTEREPELYQLLNSNANYVELADIISRSVMVMDVSDPAAKIGDAGYATVQEAINAAVTGADGTYEIVIQKNINENIIIPQVATKNIVLNGNSNTLTGNIKIYGRSNAGSPETLTIHNLVFNVPSSAEAGIYVPNDAPNYGGTNYGRYSHNVTVSGCSFYGSGQSVAAIKFATGGDANWKISGCYVDSGMHSLIQGKNINGLTIESSQVYSKNGISLNNSTNVQISGNTVAVTGYAVRVGDSGTSGGDIAESISLTNNSLSSSGTEDAPVVIRGTASNAFISMSGNTVSAQPGYPHIKSENLATDNSPAVSADANYWGGSEPLTDAVLESAVDVDSYYTDAGKTDLAYPNAVAKVGDTPFASLTDAIAQANTSGGTVTLLDNVSLSASVKVSGTVTLDLNGHTITSSEAGQYGAIYVSPSGNLTINDSSNPSTGGIINTDGTALGVYGILTVNGGKFTGAEDSAALYNFYYDGSTYGKSTITGGSFNTIWNSGELTANGGSIDYLDNSGKSTIAGGANVTKILAKDGSDAPALTEKGTIVGADALKDVIVTEDGYVAVYVDDKYISVAENAVAIVNDTGYTTLAEAVAAAKPGATIELLNNVTSTKPIVISKNLSINGNGKTLTYTGSDRAITVENTSPGVNLSISNLTVNAPSAQRGINYNTTGKLTLNKVEVTAGTYAVNLPGSSNGAVVDIDDSKLSANIALNIWGSNANITVDNSALSCLDKTDVESYSAIQLNNDGTNIANGTTVTVTGGSISAEDDSSVVSNWTTTGVVNISSTTTVNGNPPAITVANIGGYGFNTLQDAVKWHAEHNSTANIVLLRDVSLTENLVITRDVTIVPHSSNGYGLSSDGGKISVADNATLTIDGNYSKEQIAAFRQLCAEGMCVYEGSIKVTKGHTGGTAACDAQAVCDRCQLPYGSTPDHTMKTAATCNAKAICDVCNKPYGELDPDNHALVYTGSGNTITETCSNGCGHSATAKLELDSSVSTVYTGSEIKPLKVTYSEKWMAEKNLTVSYKDNIAIGKDASGTIEKVNKDDSKATATAKFEITRATYSLVVNNYRYVRGSGYPLSFTTNVPYSAGNTVTKLLIYRANGTPVMEVPAAHFVLSANNSGMTVITLSPTVMNALDALHYELYASFTNGDAKGAFRVLLPFIFPMTGDDAQTVVLLCVMFIALGTAGVTLFIMRRKNKANRHNGRH